MGMKTLGIDPGYSLVGFGILEEDRVLDYGCIKTENKPDKLHSQLSEIIQKHKPDVMAIEKLFFSKNTKTAMRVGEGRGVIMLAAAQAKLPVAEYSPSEIKLAVTGYGQADKKQIQMMVKALLKLSEIPQPDDAADALAVAICHQNSYRLKEQTK
jgi:crossover junction endodeoxyribonuclease RuvC